MKMKDKKGYAVVSVAVSIVIIFIFVSLISMLIYNYNSDVAETKLKAEATAIAVDEIETIKSQGIEPYEGVSKRDGSVVSNEEVQPGFFKTVDILDYADIEGNEDKMPDLVKKATVTISYKYKNKIESVELSTILSKEN